MSSKPKTLEEALLHIKELEIENKKLKDRVAYLESREHGGRRKHDAKWQESYNKFVDLYVAGEKIPQIVEVSDFSLRTAYRYKEYYDKINGKK